LNPAHFPVTAKEANAIVRLAEDWVAGHVRNQPVMAGESGRRDIGHDSFAAAKDAWLPPGRPSAFVSERRSSAA
jgi:hypothetical protein